jgi:hypothetical protein
VSMQLGETQKRHAIGCDPSSSTIPTEIKGNTREGEERVRRVSFVVVVIEVVFTD